MHAGINLIKNRGNYKSGVFSNGELDESNFKGSIKKLGTAFHEAFKSPNEPSKSYESLISVCKAAWFNNQKFSYLDGNEESFDPEKFTELYISIPVIILDGKLFKATLNNGDIQINEADIIQVQLNYSSKNYDEHGICFFPDVVSIQSVESYLQQTEHWCEKMFENFKKTLNFEKGL